MKTMLYLSLFFSSSVFACPDLTGRFLCRYNSNVSMKEISKTEKGLNVNSDGYTIDYVLDGKYYDVPSTDSYQNAEVASSCSNDKMIVDFRAEILYEGSVIAKEFSRSQYFFKGAKLIIEQKIKMKGLPMPKVQWTCERQ